MSGGLSTLSLYRDVVDVVKAKVDGNRNVLQLQYFNYLFPPNTQHTLTFAPTTEHNIVLTENRRIVCVNNLKVKASYAFLSKPMKLGDVLVCRVMNCDTNISPVLLFGLTTCNPATLENRRLPEETAALIAQFPSAQWFIDSETNCTMTLFDEMAIWFDSSGQVHLSLNNRPAVQLTHRLPPGQVNSMILYPFFDLYGQITSLCTYNYSPFSQIDVHRRSDDSRGLCSICCENLVDSQLMPCLCVLCHVCATTIKQTNLLSDCPFDRQHITQIRPLS